MSQEFILSIDEGTTGSTALLIDTKDFKLVDKHNLEFKQIYPKPSWVEHDLNEIWLTVEKTIEELLAKNNIKANQIKAIGITNQRETTCAFNKKGEPLCHAIVWQDRRTADFCEKNKDEFKKRFQKKTGLPLDPYFSGTKIKWLLENNDLVKASSDKDDLYFGTIDTYLVFKMTAGESFVTEPSNASRTLLMDLKTSEWDNELLDYFNIKATSLPSIKDSFSLLGRTKGMRTLPDGIPITCILGDQQAALFGQAGFKKGEMKCTYGTGAFLLLNIGEKISYSTHGLLTTVAYKHAGKTIYAFEGTTYIAGAAVQWLRDNLKLIPNSSAVEALARSVTDMNQMEHLSFFPFFTGIGTPYWNSEAKGAIVGLTRDTENRHLALACLEGIALSINDSIQSLIQDGPVEVKNLKVDGGASANNLLMSLQANFSQLEIIRPEIIETTAYGVALGAMVGLGEIQIEELSKFWREEKRFKPQNDLSYFENKKNKWTHYIKRVFSTT